MDYYLYIALLLILSQLVFLHHIRRNYRDAMESAQAYIEAGADGIMIHSKKDSPDEIIEFCELYSKLKKTVPLVAVPST